MKAIQVAEFGDPARLSVAEIPERAPSSSEVKLHVHGVGVGYFDGLLIKGEYQIKPPLPFVPGSSLSGVVVEVGDGVTHLAPGDHVAGFALLGGLAEYAYLPSNFAFKIPTTVPLDDAANFFISYATAVLGLDQLAKVQPGESVLVLGASGSTGSTAIEVACGPLGVAIVIALPSSVRPPRTRLCVELGKESPIVQSPTGESWLRPCRCCVGEGRRSCGSRRQPV